MAGIQSFSGGSTSRNLLGNGTNGAVSDSQNPVEQNAQNKTTEQQFSGMTTEERLKSSQSPLDDFLSDTSQLASDTADAVADLATDAYQGMKAINQAYALDQRAMGALKMLGGAGEAFVGGVGIMTPEPLTSVGGGILFVHGADVASSGFLEMLTGKPVETVTDQVATESAKLVGADDATAQQFGDNVDMAISLGSAGVGVHQALTRPVLAELGPMTIKSSTKAEPASELSAGAKTQAGNEAALTAEVAETGLSAPVKVMGDVAESAGPTGKLQAAEGVNKTKAPEFTTTMRVGSCAPSKLDLQVLSKDAPIAIPETAKIAGPVDKVAGYKQISYKWDEEIAGRNNRFEARWHEPTPNAPEGTVTNWRVTRTLSGSPDGSFKKEVYELVRGDSNSNLWIPESQFRAATKAWSDGTATPAQIDLLKRAHFE